MESIHFDARVEELVVVWVSGSFKREFVDTLLNLYIYIILLSISLFSCLLFHAWAAAGGFLRMLQEDMVSCFLERSARWAFLFNVLALLLQPPAR